MRSPYAVAVEEEISKLNRSSRDTYLSRLRVIFLGVSRRSPETNSELYRAAWNRLNRKQVEDAVRSQGHKSPASFVSVWKFIIKTYKARGLLEVWEYNDLMEDERQNSGEWSTQRIPVEGVLIPAAPSTHPFADSSRHQPTQSLYPATWQQESS